MDTSSILTLGSILLSIAALLAVLLVLATMHYRKRHILLDEEAERDTPLEVAKHPHPHMGAKHEETNND